MLCCTMVYVLKDMLKLIVVIVFHHEICRLNTYMYRCQFLYIDSLACKRSIYGLEQSSYKNMPAFLMYLKIRANIYQIEFVLSTGIKLHLHVLIIFFKFTQLLC